MKKLGLVLLLLAGLGAGGGYLWSRYRQGSDVADEYAMQSFTPAELREALRSDDLRTRLDAFAQIEQLEPDVRKGALLEALAADHAPTRLTAVTALRDGFPTDPAVVDRLLDAAGGDPDGDVRAAALSALERSGDPRVLALAAELLTSVDAGLATKLAAAETLDRLTGRETAGALGAAVEEAETAADEIGMDWEEWLDERSLRWDPDRRRFEAAE